MNFFDYRHGELHGEDVPLSRIAAAFGTPCYVYSRSALETAWHAFDTAFAALPRLICYAVKANSNLAILGLFARLGAGFDIVSGGELKRVIAAGGDPAKVVFSGVGKSEAEMRLALEANIHCFNVESEAELLRLNAVAGQLGCKAPISLRVNPDVDPRTHPYISTGLRESKFGIEYDRAAELYHEAARLPHLAVRGIDCHIGSQITELEPFLDALDRILALVERLAAGGIPLEHLDLGGGIGIRYRDETPPDLAAYAAQVARRLDRRPLKLLLEPGRALVGNAGILLTRVEYLKPGSHRNFAIVDAAMNDLMRPALYDAWHAILPVLPRREAPRTWEIVGPVCESGDFLGHDRSLALESGDLLAVMSAGAYGMSMSSNYNSRPRAAEVMVSGSEVHLIREREPVEALYALERLLPPEAGGAG